MKTLNAFKMIERAGSKLETDPAVHGGLIARFGYYNIELTNQDAEIIAIKVVPAREQADGVSDYYPGDYFPSLTQAIDYVLARKDDGNVQAVQVPAPAGMDRSAVAEASGPRIQYQERQDKIQKLLEEIQGGLQSHASRANQVGIHWGHVGDLGSYIETLEQLKRNVAGI